MSLASFVDRFSGAILTLTIVLAAAGLFSAFSLPSDIYPPLVFPRVVAIAHRFMSHLREVTDLGGGRSHWVAEGPADIPVEWDAQIINEVPNEVIGWRSVPGSDIATAGSVHFSPARLGRSTQVSVHLQYAAPGGKASRLLAYVLGRDPASMIREDLRRVKQILEAGEIPRATKGAEG